MDPGCPAAGAGVSDARGSEGHRVEASVSAPLEVFYRIAAGGYVARTDISVPGGLLTLTPRQMGELQAEPDFRRVLEPVRVTLDRKPR